MESPRDNGIPNPNVRITSKVGSLSICFTKFFKSDGTFKLVGWASWISYQMRYNVVNGLVSKKIHALVLTGF